MKTPIRFLFTLLLAVVVSLPSVHAATTYTVQNTGDDWANAANCPGPSCRLRDALAKVVDGDTIDFSVRTPATITLNRGELLVNKSVTIGGPGANMLAVDGNRKGRVFHITSGKTVIISSLTITNGNAIAASRGADPDGGGIYNDQATLTIINSTVSGNSGLKGGGIFNGAGTVTVNNCTISGNIAGGEGGGLCNFNFSGVARLIISNSTISGNSLANGAGGAIFNSLGADVTVRNSTISGNNSGFGFGIFNEGQLGIGDTILNRGVGGNIHDNRGGMVTSLGYNLSSDDGSGLLTGPGDQINTDPMLLPLQNYGGPTLTHALLAFSPAIDHGNPGFAPPPDTDQRGCPFTRVYNGRIDVGSFEGQPTAPPCPTPRPRPTPPPR